MFNLPELADWATEDASTFAALAAELDARWREAGDDVSWPVLMAPTCEVVDMADPAPWWLVELDNARPRVYPVVPLRELWNQLCPVSLTAWTREQAAELAATLDAGLSGPVEPSATVTPAQALDAMNAVRRAHGIPERAAETALDVTAEPGPLDDAEPAPTRWARFWGSHGVRTTGVALGVAACLAAVVVAGAFYWSAWVSG